jgi:hypothetical protein
MIFEKCSDGKCHSTIDTVLSGFLGLLDLELFISLYKRLKRVMTYEVIEEEVSYCFLVVHD